METMIIANAARAIRHMFIRDMILPASIGVLAHEHQAAQRVRINVDLGVQDDGLGGLSRPRAMRESLSRVVDYGAVAATIRAIVAAGHIVLVETLAERIAEACLADPRVHVARVRVEKLDVFADAASAGIEIERRQSDLSTRAKDAEHEQKDE
jgi:7,8-dihydroneopterin aldolase/epimerase/oxygenase